MDPLSVGFRFARFTKGEASELRVDPVGEKAKITPFSSKTGAGWWKLRLIERSRSAKI